MLHTCIHKRGRLRRKEIVERKELEVLEKIAAENTLEANTIKPTKDFVSTEQLHRELVDSVLKYHPSTDMTMIERAYQIAKDAHEGQVRRSGEPYIVHPLCVATILAELEMDKETIVSGLLHDVVEDTVMTMEEIEETFNAEVALLVDGVTKLGQLTYDADRIEVQAENLRKMFLAMAKDIRVIIIKLADRLHNMRTLKYMKPEKQKEKARETMEIYAPIAQRLGIAKIKVELEDLSLKYLHPDAYYELVETIAARKDQREAMIDAIVLEVRELMDNAQIEATVYGRAKHFFSIYKKMVNQNKTIDEIYDLFAIRIIVKDVKSCYAALGIIHEKYKPVPGRFKDYIAMPKPNMYQSIHTTLTGSDGQRFEVQIRTEEMHKTCEYGIAAHWKYKEQNNGGGIAGEEEKLTWLRRILEWQQDMSDNKEFMDLLKEDLNLFADEVFCFTPQGDVKNLPKGSTPIDFAYSVHSAVGNKMIGAKVNGVLVNFDYQIQNGDRVEILTSQNSRGPSRDWLKIVKSAQAKNKINQWFRNEFKEENIVKGREQLMHYCKLKGFNFNELNKPEYQEKIQRKYGFQDWDSVLAAVGHGGLKEAQIINRMIEEYRAEQKSRITDADIVEETNAKAPSLGGYKDAKKRTESGVLIRGMSGVAVHLSKCCSPLPGDEIIGFITRGRGVTVHRTDCVNIIKLPEWDKDRLIEAEWLQGSKEETTSEERYLAELMIYGYNRTGLLVDISKVFTERNIDIESINSRTNRDGIATITIAFRTKGKDELTSLAEKIRQVENVYDIKRTTS